MSFFQRLPLVRQLLEGDLGGLGKAAQSPHYADLKPRTSKADRVTQSVCPYCAVGCGQLVYVQDGEVTQIEGDPDSPISRGRLCPKGSASKGLIQSPVREYKVKYRAPYSRHWQALPLEKAMEMIADRVISTRNETWETTETTARGTAKLNRTLGLGSLGGATLDNEENYLIKKLFTALGIVSVENQARI